MDNNLIIKRLSLYQGEIGKRTKLLQKSISHMLEDGYSDIHARDMMIDIQELIEEYKKTYKCLSECYYNEEKSLNNIKNIISLLDFD